MTTNHKQCKHCNESKDASLFVKDSYKCKKCDAKRSRERCIKLRERDVSSIVFPESKVCPKCKIEKEFKDFGVDLNNINGVRSYCRKCHNKLVDIRKGKSPLWKFKKSQSKRIRTAMKNQNNEKSDTTLKYLGCSALEGKLHIEKQFREGMSWDNYGSSGWHIDHIKPLAKCDLNNEEEIARAFHYTNLQPLWWWENIEKSDKWQNTTSE